MLRDLTPHPQYAAFYKWLQLEYQADVVLHFGMHGTVEVRGPLTAFDRRLYLE
jgi:cobalamin biosynthesis Mg chelatase CobN